MCAQLRFRSACTFDHFTGHTFLIDKDTKFLHADNEDRLFESSSSARQIFSCWDIHCEYSIGLGKIQGPVVKSIVNLTSLLMTNLLTVVAKVFSNTLIFLLQKCE